LNFTLRFCHDPTDPHNSTPVTSPSQLREMVKYTPLELDKETKEFANKLDFLGDAFTFRRNQLPLFINTMHENLGEASRNGEGEEQERSGEGMEVEDS